MSRILEWNSRPMVLACWMGCASWLYVCGFERQIGLNGSTASSLAQHAGVVSLQQIHFANTSLKNGSQGLFSAKHESVRTTTWTSEEEHLQLHSTSPSGRPDRHESWPRRTKRFNQESFPTMVLWSSCCPGAFPLPLVLNFSTIQPQC